MKTFSCICLFVLVVILFAACNPGTTAVPPIATQNNSSATSIPHGVTQNDLPTTATMPVIQADNPYAPQVGDDAMMSSGIKIDVSSLNLAKSMPPQATLDFAYFQPTPCFHLRVIVSQPDAQNRIEVKAYAVAEKNKVCTLMALATPLKASLNLGGFPNGHYSVWLNDMKVDEFDS